MNKRLLAMLIAAVAAVPATMLTTPVEASPEDEYTSAPYFGEDNFPPGCTRSMSPNDPDNVCHRMRTGLNGLDSPQVDVLVMVPVSPTAERDMRIMRQSIEMWEAGIDYLAEEMGLDWLADGMDFHITVDAFDPAGEDGGEFTTYPIVDPEIVVIATNPVGGIGIGIDPVDFLVMDEEGVPCHNVQNPFDFEYWENLPGFDSHHDSRSGTYVEEDCGGAGGNICFAINGAIDPAPEQFDFFGLFDLVSHEVGHCLTLGHVGDGAEGTWGALPSNDIMAYSQDPPGLTKCVSTLDVEGIAIRMSDYLDVGDQPGADGDGLLLANDQIGDGLNPFQVQHPDDHLYASSTGSPMDCPQPDLGLTPGERTQWTPAPAATHEDVLTVTSPEDGAVADDGAFRVTGTVERRALHQEEPADPSGSIDDAHDDASTPVTEILGLAVAITEEASGPAIRATIALEELWPTTDVASPTSYSLSIDGRRFDSFIRYPFDANPQTWDDGAGGYMGSGTSTWDLEAKTVTFDIGLDYLDAAGIEAPYEVSSQANLGSLTVQVVDDTAPDDGDTVRVAPAARSMRVGSTGPSVRDEDRSSSRSFGDPKANTFYPEDSSAGLLGGGHEFHLVTTETSDVTFTLTWSDTVGGTDLDLYVTGARSSANDGATAATTETATIPNVRGWLDIVVDPFLVTDPMGSTYTLTAEIEPTQADEADADLDTVLDVDDACPVTPGRGEDGCSPPRHVEQVVVYVDGVLAGTEDVVTADGVDAFDLPVDVPEGVHELRIDWERNNEVVATRTVTVAHGRDRDGDGIVDGDDSCPKHADPQQADEDGDGQGDLCDRDLDGDGHGNRKEDAHGTDPTDPASYPGKGRGGDGR